MLKFYYTVTSAPNDGQIKISNSLGGYRSSTEVQNDVLDNLFDDLSIQTVSNPRDQYIALILRNDDVAKYNVQLWFGLLSELPHCSYQIGAIQMNQDEDGNSWIQNTNTMYERPSWITFYDATEENKAYIGNLEPNQEVGIWIKRKINTENVNEDYNNVAVRDPKTYNRYMKPEKEKEETVELCVLWD